MYIIIYGIGNTLHCSVNLFSFDYAVAHTFHLAINQQIEPMSIQNFGTNPPMYNNSSLTLCYLDQFCCKMELLKYQVPNVFFLFQYLLLDMHYLKFIFRFIISSTTTANVCLDNEYTE